MNTRLLLCSFVHPSTHSSSFLRDPFPDSPQGALVTVGLSSWNLEHEAEADTTVSLGLSLLDP